MLCMLIFNLFIICRVYIYTLIVFVFTVLWLVHCVVMVISFLVYFITTCWVRDVLGVVLIDGGGCDLEITRVSLSIN